MLRSSGSRPASARPPILETVAMRPIVAPNGLDSQADSRRLARYFLALARHDEPMVRRRLPRRLAQLYIGLLLYGLAGALQVRSGLGLDPWDVFHQGLAEHLGLAIGTVVII